MSCPLFGVPTVIVFSGQLPGPKKVLKNSFQAVNVTGRENTPFPRRRGRIGQFEMVAEDISGTLQDYTLVFQHDNKGLILTFCFL